MITAEEPKKVTELTRRNSLADYNVSIRNEYLSKDESDNAPKKRGNVGIIIGPVCLCHVQLPSILIKMKRFQQMRMMKRKIAANMAYSENLLSFYQI